MILLALPPQVRRTSVFAPGKTLKWTEFISGHLRQIGAPAKVPFAGPGKKKMRNLGTVQVPTEAFMAVLKLDSD